MKWDVIWPVMTLALGWLLGELSGIIKSSRGRHEELRLITFRILALLDDLELFLYLCDQLPLDAVKAASTQKAEDLREQLFRRWSNQQELVQSEMDKVITPVARFDPALAYQLHSALVTLRSLSKPKISEAEGALTSTEIIAFNAMRQSVSRELERDLRAMSEQLARKVGPFTARRVRLLLQGRTGTDGLHRAEEIMTEMKDTIEKERNASE